MTRKPGAAGAARETLRVETPDPAGAGVPLHSDPDAGERRTAPRPPSCEERHDETATATATDEALAGLDVGRFFDLFDLAWPFYGTLIAITSGSAVALHLGRRRRPVAAWGGEEWHGVSGDPYTMGGEGGDAERLDLPRPPVGER